MPPEYVDTFRLAASLSAKRSSRPSAILRGSLEVSQIGSGPSFNVRSCRPCAGRATMPPCVRLGADQACVRWYRVQIEAWEISGARHGYPRQPGLRRGRGRVPPYPWPGQVVR